MFSKTTINLPRRKYKPAATSYRCSLAAGVLSFYLPINNFLTNEKQRDFKLTRLCVLTPLYSSAVLKNKCSKNPLSIWFRCHQVTYKCIVLHTQQPIKRASHGPLECFLLPLSFSRWFFRLQQLFQYQVGSIAHHPVANFKRLTRNQKDNWFFRFSLYRVHRPSMILL